MRHMADLKLDQTLVLVVLDSYGGGGMSGSASACQAPKYPSLLSGDDGNAGTKQCRPVRNNSSSGSDSDTTPVILKKVNASHLYCR